MDNQYHSEFLRSLIDFILRLPLPESYGEILREQIANSTIRTERYSDCLKILFMANQNTKSFPLGLPTLLQGGQIITDRAPISFHLFVENGYVVQFEVVDMGLEKIDWGYFWSHTPVYDIKY